MATDCSAQCEYRYSSRQVRSNKSTLCNSFPISFSTEPSCSRANIFFLVHQTDSDHPHSSPLASETRRTSDSIHKRTISAPNPAYVSSTTKPRVPSLASFTPKDLETIRPSPEFAMPRQRGPAKARSRGSRSVEAINSPNRPSAPAHDEKRVSSEGSAAGTSQSMRSPLIRRVKLKLTGHRHECQYGGL